jgi:hypothetical protein
MAAGRPGLGLIVGLGLSVVLNLVLLAIVLSS